MNYVISDIHGDYEKYKAMLEKIGFSDADTLYVLGDVIDRGRQGTRILRDMMLRANVIPILGNHEYMASVSLPWLLTEVTEESAESIDPQLVQGVTEWMSVGGDKTVDEFSSLDEFEREDLLDYLSEFELYDVVKTQKGTFVLVHAGLDNFSAERRLEDYDLSELLFHSPDYNRVYFEDKYLVTGHIPTRVMFAGDNGAAPAALSETDENDRIFMKNRHISIDCGCAYGGRLGCICLDTMEEFYV